MSKVEKHLAEYAKFHQNETNIRIHKFCVPALMFSIIGLLKALPVPMSWPLWLDWSVLAILSALIFYALQKNVKLFISMILFTYSMVLLLEYLRPRFFLLCLFIFVVARILQIIGHKIEGKKPDFFTGVFFLLIGPLWFVKSLTDKRKTS